MNLEQVFAVWSSDSQLLFSKFHFLCIWPPSHLTVAHLKLRPKAELFLLQLLPLLKGWLEWSLDATGESFSNRKMFVD